MKRPKRPKGYPSGRRVKIAVAWPEELFDALCDAAEAEDKSFSQIVIIRVKAGIMCLDESDALEPAKKIFDNPGPDKAH